MSKELCYLFSLIKLLENAFARKIIFSCGFSDIVLPGYEFVSKTTTVQLIFRLLQSFESQVADLEAPTEQILKSIEKLCKEELDSPISSSLQAKQKKIENLRNYVKSASVSRRKSLEESLDACKKFWPGIDKLHLILQDVKGSLESQEEPRINPKVIEALQREHEVGTKIPFRDCFMVGQSTGL